MTTPGWSELTRQLATDIAALDSFDTRILEHGPFYVQLQQLPGKLTAQAISNTYLPTEHQLNNEQQQQLAALGWQPPNPDNIDNWHHEQDLPLGPHERDNLAQLLAETLHTVYSISNPADITFSAFNAHRR